MEIKRKIVSLDVLRGLACLAVLINHTLMLNPIFIKALFSSEISDNYFINIIRFSPLKFLWDGHAAVILFFVLSGYVLSISFFRKSKMNYKFYLVKRICRIYLPYVALVAIGAIGSNYYLDYLRLSKFSDWLNSAWSQNVSFSDFFGYLFFNDVGSIHTLSQSIWSLPIEIKISLFLPFVIVLFKRTKPQYDLLLILLNMILYHGGKRLGLQEMIPEFSLLYYLTFFMAGIVLYKHHEKIVFKISNLSAKLKALLYVVAILLYTNYCNIDAFAPKLVDVLSKIALSDYLVTLGSVLLMSLVLAEDSKNKFLSNKYLGYVGKISFSLYLIHPIIIMLVCFNFGKGLSFFVLHLLCFIASLIAAIIFYRIVELPTQNLGLKLSKKLKK
jgi:peptidoglycan/LPS O-acetylase OafA/YrhL